MKILYAVQATGNGHISRALELIPHLQRYGIIDVFLSGDNSNLSFDFPVKYRSKGVSLYGNSRGGLDYWKIARSCNPLRIHNEINDLPVENYDLVINDFEYITAAACRRKGVYSIHLGHQASFQSSLTPRPCNKNLMGEWILKNYAKATNYIGLHFEQYDDFIFPPIIKSEILEAEPVDKGYITVYLPSYSLNLLEQTIKTYKDVQFQVFSKEVKQPAHHGNIMFFPVNQRLFNKSLIECHGIITGAGFETPAESLYLGKKILAVPTRGQYEQSCNAAALERMEVMCSNTIDKHFSLVFDQWMNIKKSVKINYNQAIPRILDYMFTLHAARGNDHYSVTSEMMNDGNPALSF